MDAIELIEFYTSVQQAMSVTLAAMNTIAPICALVCSFGTPMDDCPVYVDDDVPPAAIFENKCEVLVPETPELAFIQPKNEARTVFRTREPLVSRPRVEKFLGDVQFV